MCKGIFCCFLCVCVGGGGGGWWYIKDIDLFITFNLICNLTLSENLGTSKESVVCVSLHFDIDFIPFNLIF